MKLSQQEKAAHRAAFRNMSVGKKLDHILTYYKGPILLTLAALLILGSVLHRQLTEKDPVLYTALVNVVVGPELEDELGSGYLNAVGADLRRQEVYCYSGLYLSADADVVNHEYAYASRMKLMGAIQARRLDLVLMNREAYDSFSENGYLLDLAALLSDSDPALYDSLAPALRENEVILEDNQIAYMLNEAEQPETRSQTVCNALELTDFPLFQDAGYEEPVYLGIVANSPRLTEAVRYLSFLTSGTF